MDWEKFNVWYNYLLTTQYKDNLISIAIGEFRRVASDNNQTFQNKKDIKKDNWLLYGKINNTLDKINKKYKLNMGLPRLQCATVQKFKKMDDIIIGKMYNIPAISNGIDTTDKSYFFVPIHKTRRHVHGVPKEFLENYIINMIETAQWEKRYSVYYYEYKYIDRCAIYTCPEKYIQEGCKIKKTNKKEVNGKKIGTEESAKNKIVEGDATKQVEINCKQKISVYLKIRELRKYLNGEQIDKITKFFHKKRIDNFRTNFPSKSRYITYCTGNCCNSIGYIHNGIPNGKQKCILKFEDYMFLNINSVPLSNCNITYCRECGVSPFHENEMCKFVDEIAFENPEKYRKCPGCCIWVEKEIGCDHMQCLCGVHFCYNCRGVLNAHDPYFHVCRMGNTDPHFRDFLLDHEAAFFPGEVACNCLNCK